MHFQHLSPAILLFILTETLAVPFSGHALQEAHSLVAPDPLTAEQSAALASVPDHNMDLTSLVTSVATKPRSLCTVTSSGASNSEFKIFGARFEGWKPEDYGKGLIQALGKCGQEGDWSFKKQELMDAHQDIYEWEVTGRIKGNDAACVAGAMKEVGGGEDAKCETGSS